MLGRHLSGAQPLTAPQKDIVKPRDEMRITVSAWKSELKDIEQRKDKIRQQTYNIVSVTEEVKKGSLAGTGLGKGKDWGTLVHNALELCRRGKRDDLEPRARQWLAEAGFHETKLEDLLTQIDNFMKTDFWQRLEKSEEKYFEVPFAIQEIDTLHTGQIDVVFMEKEGWVFADYKTDDFEKDQKRKQAYLSQLNKYAEYWIKITNVDVSEKKIVTV